MTLFSAGTANFGINLAGWKTIPFQATDPGTGFSDWLLTLEPLSWFVGILGVILPVVVVIFRRPLTAVWFATPWMETWQLNQLSKAKTLPDFEKTIRSRQGGSRDFAALGLNNSANLTSKLYILPRTYVEAFIRPNNDVYGYSIMLRRPSWIGTVRVSHYKVKLGRTTFAKFPNATMVTPTQRDFSYFEVMPSAKATSYMGFAAGMSSGNANGRPWSFYLVTAPLFALALVRSRNREDARQFNEHVERGRGRIQGHYNLQGDQVVHPHPDFYGTPDFELWRKNTPINYVSVAHFGDVLLNMINCHGDLLQNYDYRDWPRKARERRRMVKLLSYSERVDYLWAKYHGLVQSSTGHSANRQR